MTDRIPSKLILLSWPTERTSPCRPVVKALRRHLQSSVTCSGAEVQSSNLSRELPPPKNDEQGDNTVQEEDGLTVSSIKCDHPNTLTSSVKAVSCASVNWSEWTWLARPLAGPTHCQ